MRRSPVQSSRPETSNHTLFWVDFITITPGSKFSTYTGAVARFSSPYVTSISSTSVTVITSGVGCSITSTATVSTNGAIGCFTFRATFFTGAGLGLGRATVRFVAFAALDTLRALARLAELRSLAGFCTFDAFLRLAMIAPLVLRNDTTVQVAASYQIASYQQIAA
jgi:hypothetical protein